MTTTSPIPKTRQRRRAALAAPTGSESPRLQADIVHGKEPYSTLRLSIEMDDIAAWIKRHKPDWTPKKLADELRAEVERIEDEMTDGSF